MKYYIGVPYKAGNKTDYLPLTSAMLPGGSDFTDTVKETSNGRAPRNAVLIPAGVDADHWFVSLYGGYFHIVGVETYGGTDYGSFSDIIADGGSVHIALSEYDGETVTVTATARIYGTEYKTKPAHFYVRDLVGDEPEPPAQPTTTFALGAYCVNSVAGLIGSQSRTYQYQGSGYADSGVVVEDRYCYYAKATYSASKITLGGLRNGLFTATVTIYDNWENGKVSEMTFPLHVTGTPGLSLAYKGAKDNYWTSAKKGIPSQNSNGFSSIYFTYGNERVAFDAAKGDTLTAGAVTPSAAELTQSKSYTVPVTAKFKAAIGDYLSASGFYSVNGQPKRVSSLALSAESDETNKYWEARYVPSQKFLSPSLTATATFNDGSTQRLSASALSYGGSQGAVSVGQSVGIASAFPDGKVKAVYSYDNGVGTVSTASASYGIAFKGVERAVGLTIGDSDDYWEFAYIRSQKFIIPTSSFVSVTMAVAGEGKDVAASDCTYYRSEADAEAKSNALAADSALTSAGAIWARYDYHWEADGYSYDSHAVTSYQIREKTVKRVVSISIGGEDNTWYYPFDGTPTQPFSAPTVTVTATYSDGTEAVVTGSVVWTASGSATPLSKGSEITSPDLVAYYSFSDERNGYLSSASAPYTAPADKAYVSIASVAFDWRDTVCYKRFDVVAEQAYIEPTPNAIVTLSDGKPGSADTLTWHRSQEDAESGTNALGQGDALTKDNAVLWARVGYTDPDSGHTSYLAAPYEINQEAEVTVETGDGFQRAYYWDSSKDTALNHNGVSVFYGPDKTPASLDGGAVTIEDPEILWDEDKMYSFSVSLYIASDDEKQTRLIKGSASYGGVWGHPKRIAENGLAANSPARDTLHYYQGARLPQRFAAPTEFGFTATFNDGSSADVTASVAYYLSQEDAEAQANPLSGDVDVGSPERIYARYDFSNALPDGHPTVSSHAITSYAIDLIKNSVTGVRWKGEGRPTVYFGNQLASYKKAFDGLLEVTREHGETDDLGTDNFSFADKTVQMPNDAEIEENGGIAKPVSIVFGGTAYSLDGVVFAKPTAQTPVIEKKGALDMMLNNNVDGIDLTSTTIRVFYKDGDGNAVSHQDVLSYDETNNAASRGGRYSVTCTDKLLPAGYKFNGETLSLELADSTGHTFQGLSLNALSSFSSEVVSLPISVTIFDVDNVASISRGERLVDNDGNGSTESCFKTSYYVGEEFLADGDKSNVRVTYKAQEEAKGLITLPSVFLADEPPYLNVYPPKGTIFDTAGQRTVTVRSAFDANVYLTYVINVVTRLVTSDDEPTDFRFWKLQAPRAYKAGGTEYGESELKQGAYVLVTATDYDRLQSESESIIGSTDADEGKVKLYGYVPCVLSAGEAKALRNAGDARYYGEAKALTEAGKTLDNAKLILFYDYLPEVTGESNIEVAYPCYNEGNSGYIDKCTFGKLFGNNNAKNRLFLSGNPDRRNRDWHSGAVMKDDLVSEENGDFSYFADTSYCDYGMADNAVVGYDIVSDNKLLVLKTYSDKEPTVYYRTSTLVQATNDDGTVSTDINGGALYSESYPLTIGDNYGSGAISPRAIANFNGDTLFLSSAQEIDGLDITGISGNSLRVAHTRSYYVDPYLRRLEGDGQYGDGFLWCDADYLAAVFPGGMLLANFEKVDADSKQYEWWRTDVADVRSFLKDGRSVYCGRSDGSVILLNGDRFYDEDSTDLAYAYLDSGKSSSQVVVHPASNYIQVSAALASTLNPEYEAWYRPKAGDSVPICEYAGLVRRSRGETGADVLCEDDGGSALFTSYFSGRPDEAAKFFDKLYDGATLAYGVSEDDPSPILAEVEIKDYGGRSFYLRKGGERLSYSAFGGGRVLAFPISGEVRLGNADGKGPGEPASDGETAFESGKFALLSGTGERMDVCFSNAINEGEILSRRPVRAFYVTGPMTMGDLTQGKTIWGTSIANDTGAPSVLEFCEVTNDDGEDGFKSLREINEQKREKNAFSYTNFSFGSVNFERFITPHVTTYWRPIGPFPFIVFGFKSEEATNAVLSAVQVKYTYAMPSFGFYS